MNTSIAPLEPNRIFKFSSHSAPARWQLDIEASCWLRSLSKHASQITFFIEYKDAIRIHRKQIDALESDYFQDCLLSGYFQIEGFGEIESIQVIVESAGPMELQAIKVKPTDAKKALQQQAA